VGLLFMGLRRSPSDYIQRPGVGIIAERVKREG
jgi:hypothetical protein